MTVRWEEKESIRVRNFLTRMSFSVSFAKGLQFIVLFVRQFASLTCARRTCFGNHVVYRHAIAAGGAEFERAMKTNKTQRPLRRGGKIFPSSITRQPGF